MGTRARIGRINPSGSITSIYTHWDGYPSHHLPILTRYYATAERVAALLALGSLSKLAPEIGEKHDFEDRSHGNWCTAHGRDRAEPNCKASSSRNEVAFAALCRSCWAEYAYARHIAVDAATSPKVPHGHGLALRAGHRHHDFTRLRLHRHQIDRMGRQKLHALGFDVVDAQAVGAFKTHQAAVWREPGAKHRSLHAVSVGWHRVDVL